MIAAMFDYNYPSFYEHLEFIQLEDTYSPALKWFTRIPEWIILEHSSINPSDKQSSGFSWGDDQHMKKTAWDPNNKLQLHVHGGWN